MLRCTDDWHVGACSISRGILMKLKVFLHLSASSTGVDGSMPRGLYKCARCGGLCLDSGLMSNALMCRPTHQASAAGAGVEPGGPAGSAGAGAQGSRQRAERGRLSRIQVRRQNPPMHALMTLARNDGNIPSCTLR